MRYLILSVLMLMIILVSTSAASKTDEEHEKLLDNTHEESNHGVEKPIKITLYGRETTIQELFDRSKTDSIADMLLIESDIAVKTIIDLNPSIVDVIAKIGGINYITRIFPKPGNEITSDSASTDYPKSIARELTTAEEKVFSIIEGESRSGKSVVLTKVLSDLRNHRTLSWSIGVDLREVSLEENWKPRDLFSKTLGLQESALFEKMLLKNPSMVNIVVDNINALPTETLQTSVLQYFLELHQKRVGVVLSIPRSMTKILSAVNLNSKTKRVIISQPLTSIEAESFLKEVWMKKLGMAHKHKIGAYAKALTRATQAAKLPMNFDTLTQLSDLIRSGDKLVFVEGGDFVSLEDFIADSRSDTLKLEKMLKSVELNTYRLYERLTAQSMPPEITADYFGLRVLESLLPPTEPNSPMALEVQAKMQESQYRGTGAEFELLQYESSGKHAFVYGKHAEFFAARVLLNHVKTAPKSFAATVTEILTNKWYRSLAEHVNSYISEHGSTSFEPILANINQENLHKALDNAFQHGFDEIGRGILEKMSPERISAYFQADSNPRSFQNPAREFGVISTVDFATVCTRNEIPFRRGMEKSLLEIQTKTGQPSANNMWKIEDFPRYLQEFMSSQTKPSWQVYKMLVENSPINALTEKFLNKLLFNVLEQGKFDNCKPIVEDLVRRGATPAIYSTTPDKSLFHLAIKQHNPEFLKFAVERWSILPPRSLLVSLLDANPLPRFSQPRTWEMMEYAIRKFPELLKPEVLGDEAPAKIIVYPQKMASPAYKVLSGTEDAAALESAILEVAVSSESLDKLPSKLRTYRRKYLLTTEPGSKYRSNPVARSLTEIVLRNRGLDTLSKFEQSAYENCVKLAFEADVKRGLSAEKISRIRRALVNNVGTTADYTFTKGFIDSQLVKNNINQMALMKMNLRLTERLNENKVSEMRKYNVQSGVSQTRAELYPRVVDAPAYLGQVSETNMKPSSVSNTPEQASWLSNPLDSLVDADIIPCMNLI